MSSLLKQLQNLKPRQQQQPPASQNKTAAAVEAAVVADGSACSSPCSAIHGQTQGSLLLSAAPAVAASAVGSSGVGQQVCSGFRVADGSADHSHKHCSSGTGDCCPTSPNAAQASGTVDRKTGNFAGLKKGFLFEDASDSSKKARSPCSAATSAASPVTASAVKGTGSSSSSSSTKQLSDESMTYVQANKVAQEKRFEIPEVQAAMKANETLLKNKDQWLTEELFQKIQKNEKLTRQICDPKFAQAITEFQTNPQAAMIRYHNNPEVQDFFKSFCGILGEHFSQLTDKPGAQHASAAAAALASGAPLPPRTPHGITGPAEALPPPASSGGTLAPRHHQHHQLLSTVPVSCGTGEEARLAVTAEEEEKRAQEIMANNEMKQILLDPAILDLFQSLKHNPERAQKLLQQGGAQFQANVRKLVDAGLLAFQR